MKTFIVIFLAFLSGTAFADSSLLANKVYYKRWSFDSNKTMIFSDSQMVIIHNYYSEGDGGDKKCDVVVYDYAVDEFKGLFKLKLVDTKTNKQVFKNILASSDLILDMDTGEAFVHDNNLSQSDEGLVFTEVRGSDSFSSVLKENGVTYDMRLDNGGRNDVNYNFIPWAVKGKGIDEYLKINTGGTFGDLSYYRIKNYDPYLLFVNGFVDKNRPGLFSNNSRVKKAKIEIFDRENKILHSQISSIIDTMSPQLVKIPEIVGTSIIKVTVVDIYKGDKYDDLCLSWCAIVYKR